MERGIFHDDLRHLRNTLWDAETNQLTILDFEMVRVRWTESSGEVYRKQLAIREKKSIVEFVRSA